MPDGFIGKQLTMYQMNEFSVTDRFQAVLRHRGRSALNFDANAPPEFLPCIAFAPRFRYLMCSEWRPPKQSTELNVSFSRKEGKVLLNPGVERVKASRSGYLRNPGTVDRREVAPFIRFGRVATASSPK